MQRVPSLEVTQIFRSGLCCHNVVIEVYVAVKTLIFSFSLSLHLAGEMRSGINIAPLCLSTPLYETNSAQLNDSGTYVCEAYVDSLNTSFETMVTIQSEYFLIPPSLSFPHHCSKSLCVDFQIKTIKEPQATAG